MQCDGCGYYRPATEEERRRALPARWAAPGEPDCQHPLRGRMTPRVREAIEADRLICTLHTSREVRS